RLERCPRIVSIHELAAAPEPVVVDDATELNARTQQLVVLKSGQVQQSTEREGVVEGQCRAEARAILPADDQTVPTKAKGIVGIDNGLVVVDVRAQSVAICPVLR